MLGDSLRQRMSGSNDELFSRVSFSYLLANVPLRVQMHVLMYMCMIPTSPRPVLFAQVAMFSVQGDPPQFLAGKSTTNK